MLSTEEGSEQDSEDVSDILSRGEGPDDGTEQETQELTTEELNAEEPTTEELNAEELTTEELTTEELTTEELTTEENSAPLMNVLRNSLRALPGQSFATTGDDGITTTTDPESIEIDQNSEPEDGADPADIDNNVPNADPNPDGDGDDSSENGAAAAA
jgi:hypothetical protein